MLTVRNVSKEFGNHPVLQGVSFSVKDGQKVALIGPNGVGKTTLLRIVAGLEQADNGEVVLQDPRGVAYLPQEIAIEEFELTIFDYLKQRAGLWEMEQEFTSRGGYRFESEAKKILAGLGLTDLEDMDVGSLSGGQRSKVMLVSALLVDAPLILLDEPTNNLDLSAITWLESFIAKSRLSFLIISHDRTLLEKVVDKVVEIDWHERTAIEFTGSYLEYLEHRQQQIRRREDKYESQQAEVARLQDSARKSRTWAEAGLFQTGEDSEKYGRGVRRDRAAKSAARAIGVERQIEAMPNIGRTQEREPLIIPLQVDAEGGQLITAEYAVAGYESGFATEPFNLILPAGGMVGILGDNGSGKSTILRTLIGEQTPLAGKVSINHRTVMGVLAQAHENMPRNRTVMEHFLQETRSERQIAHHLLARFHFLPDDTDKLIGDLSPGERARLQLATFAARQVNLLVLDEPTNHLDIDALDALVDVLRTYQGAVLFISHDRYFLSQLPDAEHYTVSERRLRRTIQ